MLDVECANMMNQAWEGDSGWVDPHEHAQAWRRQETRGDLERELQELERRGVGEEGAGGRPSQRGWEKIEEPFIEEEAEEERGCAVEPLVQVVRKVSGGQEGERCGEGGGVNAPRGSNKVRVAQVDIGQERAKRGKNFRPRGGKKKGNQEQVFISINSSGRPQLVDNLWKLGLRGTRTLVVMAQEHQTKATGLGDLQKAAADAGWKLRASAAARGDGGGASAGTALSIAKHIGCDALGGRAGLGTWGGGGKDLLRVGAGGR